MLGAGEEVVVLGRYPMLPEDTHNLWNCEDDNVTAYLDSHNHPAE